MAGMGHTRTPGAALHAWRIRAGFKHPGDLARRMLKEARRDPNSLLTLEFSGEDAESDLMAVISRYEDANEWSKAPWLLDHFLRVAAVCIVGGIPTPIDMVTMRLRLAEGSAPGDADQDRWEEGD